MKERGLFDPFFFPTTFRIDWKTHSQLSQLCSEFDLEDRYMSILCWISHSMGNEQKLEQMERDFLIDVEWERERANLVRFLEKDGYPGYVKSAVVLYPLNSVFDAPEIRIRAKKPSKTGKKRESITLKGRNLGRAILRNLLFQLKEMPPRVPLSTKRTATFHNSFLKDWGRRIFSFMQQEAGFRPDRGYEFITKLFFTLGFPLRSKNVRKRSSDSLQERRLKQIKDPWTLTKAEYTKQVRSLLAR